MRPHWIMVNWQSKLQGASKLETKTLAKLSAAQIQNNTTRGSTPGLTDPSMPEGPNNVRVPVPECKGIMGKILGHRRTKAGEPSPEVDAGPEPRPANAGPRLLLPLPAATGVTEPARATPRARRAKKQRIRQARARDEQDPASAFPAYHPPSLQEHYTQSATLIPSIEDEDSDLVTRPANATRMSSPPAFPSFPAFGTMRTPSGFAVPRDLFSPPGIYIAPTSPPPMQAEMEEEAPLRGGGYYRRPLDHRRTTSLSPSICFDCGQNDPKVRHFLEGCPSPPG